MKYRRIEYSIKNTGINAEKVREFIRQTYKVDAFVTVYPGRLKIIVSDGISSKKIDKLDNYIREQMDGKRVVAV
ncbi:MAG: hypothetical protein DRN17_06050 [Thermoplasmata archaeon]|nr:MAG: hypothetical protein DRN17_06050 [Thermoplasmata archaeon]